MYAAGPRLDERFVNAIVSLDDRSVPMAETYRRLRALSEQMGIPRPSYERVRQELRAARRRHEERGRTRELAFELAFNTRRADAVLADLLRLYD